MSRDAVGVVLCPFTRELSVVRADCRGKLYFYSQAGKVAPNLPLGQAWLKQNTKPLENYDVTVIAVGAPPLVREKALTEPGATVAPEKALTEPGATVRGSIMEFLR